MKKSFNFTIKKSCSETHARTGVFHTPHGAVHTPVFMPCGTKGSVKSMSPDDLKEMGVEIMLGNTYHLMLRPGADLIEKMGGMHKWISWDRPILTDSGGFQVFSLGHKNRILDDGVEFRSHIDGKKYLLTPKKSVQIQKKLGADIIMAFDECAPGDSSEKYAKEAMKRTHEWALQSKKEHEKLEQTQDSNGIADAKRSSGKTLAHSTQFRKTALFPIIQGGIYDNLRIESAKFMANLDLPGTAIGGLSVGESKEKMYHALEIIEPFLPKSKPRYLMGVGTPEDIIEGVARGIDMFDCVLPTRYARHGAFWTLRRREHIKNAKFAKDPMPLMENCDCRACRNFSRSYIRHLHNENEILGHRLITMHNLHFLIRLTQHIRSGIEKGTFQKFRRDFLRNFKPMKKMNDER